MAPAWQPFAAEAGARSVLDLSHRVVERIRCRRKRHAILQSPMQEVARDASFSQGGARRRKHGIADLAIHPAAYITVPALADHLGVQDRTVRKWIEAGVLPAYRFEGQRRIWKTDAVLIVERARFRA
jgi:excisionase family DNA binding protein